MVIKWDRIAQTKEKRNDVNFHKTWNSKFSKIFFIQFTIPLPFQKSNWNLPEWIIKSNINHRFSFFSIVSTRFYPYSLSFIEWRKGVEKAAAMFWNFPPPLQITSLTRRGSLCGHVSTHVSCARVWNFHFRSFLWLSYGLWMAAYENTAG